MHRKIPALLTLLVLFCAPALAGVYAVGVPVGGYPPMMFPVDDARTGVYQDILAEIGRLTGDRFVFRHLPAPRIMRAFVTGSIDIEPGVNPAWRAGFEVPGLYTGAFADSTDVAVFRTGNAFPLEGPADLAGMRVGMVRGYAFPGYTDDPGKRFTRDDGDNEVVVLNKLVRGRDDLAFVNRAVARWYLSRDGDYGGLVEGPVIGQAPISFRVRPEHADLVERMDRAIVFLREKGAITRIYEQYCRMECVGNRKGGAE